MPVPFSLTAMTSPLQRILGRWFRREDWAGSAPSPSLSAGPAARAGAAEGNPIRALLDEIELPWRLTREALVRHYGIRSHAAYRWDVIEIETARPIVDGLIWPLSAQASQRCSPFLPATRFTGATWFDADARGNLRRTAEGIAARLGEAPIEQRYNTVQCEWAAGAAALRLTAWPPELQSGSLANPAHERDPRLVTACLLEIETGFRPDATPEELAWLRGFVPIAPIAGDRRMTPDAVRKLSPPESELEFVREPPADLGRVFGRVGRSADGAALIFCHTQLYLIPSAQVLEFRVERMLPAKGGGGSWLEAECRTGYGDVPAKRVVVARADGPEDLNDLAAALSIALGKPFVLGDHGYDV